MVPTNSIFDKMVSKAMEEVSRKGWKDANPNAVTLASFGMLRKLLNDGLHSIVKPIYWFAGILGAGILWQIISGVLGL